MKFTNNIVSKFGTDALLHNAFGGLICAFIAILLTQIGLYWFWSWGIGVAVVTICSFIKERFLDSYADWYDFIMAECGCGYPLVAYLLSMLF